LADKLPIETIGIFTPTTVLLLDPIEIFASKIVALQIRAAARDLCDVSNMINAKLFDETQTETLDFDKMDTLTYHDIKTKLKPMLRKKEQFDFDAARKLVREYLTEFIILSDNEKEFLASFRNGKYSPELLFSGETLERIRSHPMAMWKMRSS
jgi:predicted nucleotidyltransferase component of viral defense system